MISTTCLNLKVLVVLLCYVWIICGENETVAAYGGPSTGPAPKPPRAADGIEALVVAFMRGLL